MVDAAPSYSPDNQANSAIPPPTTLPSRLPAQAFSTPSTCSTQGGRESSNFDSSHCALSSTTTAVPRVNRDELFIKPGKTPSAPISTKRRKLGRQTCPPSPPRSHLAVDSSHQIPTWHLTCNKTTYHCIWHHSFNKLPRRSLLGPFAFVVPSVCIIACTDSRDGASASRYLSI